MRYDEAQFERSLKPLPPLPEEERDFYDLHSNAMMLGAFGAGASGVLSLLALVFERPLWLLLFGTVFVMTTIWAAASSAVLKEGFREAHTYPRYETYPGYEFEGGFVTFTGKDT